jgi:formate dehydrogenase subunit delta
MNATTVQSGATQIAKRVTREANLIARNFECWGAQAAAAATADHIKRFWAPQLRAALSEDARAHHDGFSPIARNAVLMLGPELEGRTLS